MVPGNYQAFMLDWTGKVARAKAHCRVTCMVPVARCWPAKSRGPRGLVRTGRRLGKEAGRPGGGTIYAGPLKELSPRWLLLAPDHDGPLVARRAETLPHRVRGVGQ
jgi:hypothetical protein